MNADKSINDLTYKINGAIFEVSRTLGAGFLEKVYEKALLIELRERGLKAESQAPITISYKGHSVGELFADILDGFLKSSNSLLHCILRHCGVKKLRLIPQNLCASNLNFFICHLSLIFYGVINFVLVKLL